MKKAYLFIYSTSLGTRKQVKECISSLQEIITWRYDMRNSFYLVSEYEAPDISNEIRKYFKNKGRFLITEISENRQGMLLTNTWYFIRHKKVKIH